MPNATRLQSVLIVEDESLVLFNLEDMLIDLGLRIIGPAMRLGQALSIAEGAERPDVAILDVNLGGQAVFPVAERLVARGVPIIFATGYGREGLPAEWQSYPVLLKPYTTRDVVAALEAVQQVSSAQ